MAQTDFGTKNKKAAFVFFSPGSRTKKAGDEICVALIKCGYTCDNFDLMQGVEKVSCSLYTNVAVYDLLVIGTPIYVDHMSPPIKKFLSGLPRGEKDVIIYATFGGVGSGFTLFNMATTLTDKGYRIICGAKVRTEHTMTIFSRFPLGRLKPGDKNGPKLQAMVYYAIYTCSENTQVHVPVETFKYQTRFMYFMDKFCFNQELFFLLFLPKVIFVPSRCIKCGTCISACASGTISEIPKDFSDKDCFMCYECVFRCKSGALTVNLKDNYFLRALSILNIPFESLETRVFLPS